VLRAIASGLPRVPLERHEELYAQLSVQSKQKPTALAVAKSPRLRGNDRRSTA
jgi:hypothetical protein